LAPEPIELGQTTYPVQDLGITDANMASYQATQADQSTPDPTGASFSPAWVPNTDGTYTMTYDDGSTIKADSEGNVISSTDATDTAYTGIPTGTSSSGGAPTAAPRVGPAAAQTAAQTAQQAADFLGLGNILSPDQTESSRATRLANIGRQYDVGGTNIFNDPNDPDGVKSDYATGGSIDDLMAYLRNSK
jgi:hypothetical protein